MLTGRTLLAASLFALATLSGRRVLANDATIELDPATKHGDVVVRIELKIDGKTFWITAPTGRPGDPADDIPKGATGPEKAARVEQAINDASDGFSADLDGDGTPDVTDPLTASQGTDSVFVTAPESQNGHQIAMVSVR